MALSEEQRAANARYQREWRARRKQLIREHLGDTCKLCGAPATEVDHIDPLTKRVEVVAAKSRAELLAELAKCQALCSPCHREKTRRNGDHRRGRERGWWDRWWAETRTALGDPTLPSEWWGFAALQGEIK